MNIVNFIPDHLPRQVKRGKPLFFTKKGSGVNILPKFSFSSPMLGKGSTLCGTFSSLLFCKEYIRHVPFLPVWLYVDKEEYLSLTFDESAIWAWGARLAHLCDPIDQTTLARPSSSLEPNGDEVDNCYGNVDITGWRGFLVQRSTSELFL